MGYIMGCIVLLFMILLLISFVGFMLGMIRKKAHSSNTVVNNRSVEKLDLSRWRGGVRYPAGYYKSESDFYKSEKKLRYSK